MTRPARHGSTREWKLKPRRTPVRTGGPKIPGMRKRKRKKRTFEKITCDDDVHAGGCWRYSCGGERWIISMNRSYDERMLGSCRLRYPTLRVVRHHRSRYQPPRLFFSRTRVLVSSFSIRIVAQLLSSRPRVYSSSFPRPWRLTCLARCHRLAVPRDLRLGEVAEVRKTGGICTASYMTLILRRGGATTSSPVGRVVGQVLPGCELAPGTHVQSGSIRDLRHAVPLVTIGEHLAFLRLDVVVSRG